MRPRHDANRLFSHDDEAVELLVEKFEGNWQTEQRTRLREKVEKAKPFGKHTLAELLETDLEMRIQNNIGVDDYLELFPELAGDHETLSRLIVAELRLKFQAEQPLLVDYFGRYPWLRSEIESKIEAISRFELLDAASSGPNGNDSSPSRLAHESQSPHDLDEAKDSEDVQSGGQRYRSIQALDRGGRGYVTLARDQLVDRLVCVKTIRPEYASEQAAKERFLGEAALTGRLQHPGIIPIHSIGTNADQLPFYSMRYIRGVSLRKAIAKFYSESDKETTKAERQVAFRDLLTRFVSVCNTVAYAHEQGVIHRDLKPANVMIGDFGETFVVDWGLAKSMSQEATAPSDASRQPNLSSRTTAVGSSDVTREGDLVGSPAYMSPEQARGDIREIDAQTDVYGLGTILYEILTGRPPYGGRRATVVVATARDGAIESPRVLQRDAPRPLESICMKALAQEKLSRYVSAVHLKKDVENYLAGQSVSSHRENPFEGTARIVRNHQGTFLAACLSLLLVSVGAVLGAVQIDRSREQIRAVSEDREEARKLAQRKSDEAEGVREMLFEAIGQARTVGGQNIALAEALWSVVDRYPERFPRSAVERGRLLNDFGRTFRKRGEFDFYEKTAQLHYGIVKGDFGEEHPTTKRVEAIVVDAIALNGDDVEAIRICEALYPWLRTNLGPGHETTLATGSNFAVACRKIGDLPRAVELSLESTRDCQEQLGPTHDWTLRSIANVGGMYRWAGKLELAVSWLSKSERRYLEAGHNLPIGMTTSKGAVLVNMGQFKEGNELLRKAQQQAKKELRRAHPLRIEVARERAAALACVGDTKLADQMIRVVVKIVADEFQTKGRKLNMSIVAAYQANILEIDGQFEEAMKRLRIVEPTIAKPQRVSDHSRFSVPNAIVRLLLKQQEPVQAQQAAEEFLKCVHEAAWNKVERRWLQEQLGEALLAQGQNREAMAMFEKAISGKCDDCHFHECVVVARAKDQLGVACEKLGDYQRAAKLFSEAHRTFSKIQLTPELVHYGLNNEANRRDSQEIANQQE